MDQSICRITIVFIVGMLFFSCGNNTVKKDNPNIIYILADDLGYGDISAFNENGKINTTNIDQLAHDGIKFNDAHTSSAVCTPTRYGILTGRYNWRTRLKNGVLTGVSEALIPNTRTTVASMLKEKGYHTAFMGKWHLGWDWGLKDSTRESTTGWNKTDFDNIDFTKRVQNVPNDLGFDYAYGFSGSLDMAPYVYVENGQVTAQPDRVTVNKEKYTWWREGPTGSDFDHEDVTPNLFRKANNFIVEKSKAKEPFFLYLALPSPHTPILPTEEWLNKSQLNPYADFVLMIDHYVGELVKTLENEGMTENTIIVFTSDNGCSPEADFKLLSEKNHDPSGGLRGHKADIFEGGHRVPFIVKWPSNIKKGVTSDQLICTTDFMATCADIINYKLGDDEGEDSFSFLDRLLDTGDKEISREDIIHHSINGSFAIRKGDWKLIMCQGSGGWSFPRPNAKKAVLDSLPPIQLYNMREDQSEMQNLVDKHPNIVEELKVLLLSYIQEGRSTSGSAQKNDEIDFIWEQVELL